MRHLSQVYVCPSDSMFGISGGPARSLSAISLPVAEVFAGAMAAMSALVTLSSSLGNASVALVVVVVGIASAVKESLKALSGSACGELLLSSDFASKSFESFDE